METLSRVIFWFIIESFDDPFKESIDSSAVSVILLTAEWPGGKMLEFFSDVADQKQIRCDSEARKVKSDFKST